MILTAYPVYNKELFHNNSYIHTHFFYKLSFIWFQIKEYELSEVFHHASDDKSYEVLKMDQPSANNVDALDGNNALSLAIEEERSEREPHIIGRRPTDPMASVSPRIYSKNGSFRTTPENKYLSRY